MARSRNKVAPEKPQGQFAAFPWAVQDSPAFRQATHPARSLLFELMRQHNGANNGHLHLATGWLAGRGWTSCDVIQRAKANLLKLELIVETKKGGLNMGPSLYAVTWLPISNFVGLDMPPNAYRRSAYALKNASGSPRDGTCNSARRNGAAPGDGTENPFAVPGNGAKTALFVPAAIPSPGDNAVLPMHGEQFSGRIGCKSGPRAASLSPAESLCS